MKLNVNKGVLHDHLVFVALMDTMGDDFHKIDLQDEEAEIDIVLTINGKEVEFLPVLQRLATVQKHLVREAAQSIVDESIGEALTKIHYGLDTIRQETERAASIACTAAGYDDPEGYR